MRHKVTHFNILNESVKFQSAGTNAIPLFRITTLLLEDLIPLVHLVDERRGKCHPGRNDF